MSTNLPASIGLFSQVSFTELAAAFPECIDPVILQDSSPVHKDARFAGVPERVGQVARIGSGVTVFHDTRLHDGVSIGNGSTIGSGAILQENVRVGDDFFIGLYATLMPGVEIAYGTDRVAHNRHYARHLGSGSIIAAGVKLRGDVLLAPNTVVPSADVVKTVGYYGPGLCSVTVQGSQAGPKFNVGYLMGLSHESFVRWTNLYTPMVCTSGLKGTADFFKRLGGQVQTAYNDHHNDVDEALQYDHVLRTSKN